MKPSILFIFVFLAWPVYANDDWTRSYRPGEHDGVRVIGDDEITDVSANDSQHTLPEMVAIVEDNLKILERRDLDALPGETYRQIRDSVRVALNVFQRTIEQKLKTDLTRVQRQSGRQYMRTEEDRAELLDRLENAVGDIFNAVDEAYADVLPAPRFDPIETRDIPLQVLKYTGTSLARLFSKTFKTVLRTLPWRIRNGRVSWGWPDNNPIPFWNGRDEKRSKLLRLMGRDMIAALQFANENAEELPPEVVAQMRLFFNNLLKKTGQSESVQNFRSHRWFVRALRVPMFIQVIHPWEFLSWIPPFVREEGDAIKSSVMGVMVLIHISYMHKVSSGYKVGKMWHRLRARVLKLQLPDGVEETAISNEELQQVFKDRCRVKGAVTSLNIGFRRRR